jgi:NitT/TauT family transport system substrate-binding protein
MAFTAKGSPQIAIATIVDSPTFMGLSVANNSTARKLDDLQGKKIGVTSPGSLTYWLVEELSRAKGWTGENKATAVVIGGNPAATYAALRTGQVEASLGGVSVGYQLELQKEGRLLAPVSEYVKEIALFVTFARTDVLKEKPDAVRRFLKGWYDAVDYMRTHKAETVAMATEVIGYDPAVSARLYDGLMSTFSTDGKFHKGALDKLHASFLDLQILEKPVDMTTLYTEEYLPKR